MGGGGAQFRVLGPMEVVEDGRPLDLGPRMPRAVLALLVMNVNRVVSLDRFIDQLWGDEPPPTAAAAVQGYVSGLRRTLEPGRAPRTPARVLVTHAPGYVLRVPADAVDAARFEAMTRAGLAELSRGRPEAAGAALRSGLALWRGAPYADLAFESFVQAETARLIELRASAGEALAEVELALGDHGAALLDLERLVVAHHLRERCWELLALAYYRSGRQSDALRALSRARTTLVEELGLEPGPSLRRLENDVLLQSPSLDWKAPVDKSPVAEPFEPDLVVDDPALAPEVASPAGGLLVGRDSELARLEAVLDDVTAGSGRIVLLSGEPGIGKTRLAHELSRRATARGALVAWGYCHEAEAAPPFWPWKQMLGALVRTAEPDLVRTVLAGGASQIAQLVAEVKDVAGVDLGPNPLIEPEAARGLLFSAVEAFVRRLAIARPVVLVIDDLHSADAASLQLLQVVCAGIRSAAVLVVCAYREVESQSAPQVVGALGHLGRQAGLVRVVLRGLTEPDVATLVEEATGRAPRPGLAQAIRARTEGNPFFVSELVALLGSRGQGEGTDAAPADRDIPAGVRDAIRVRFSRLPEEGVALLRVAAVIGREFDLGLLAASADVDDEWALDLLELALLLGVVTESVESVGGFRFSHGLVRETLYDGLPSLRRARLHRRVAEALEHLHPDRPPLGDLAHHYLEGLTAGTVDKAISYAVQLAGQATAGFAFELAEDQLVRALALLASTPAGDERSEREIDIQVQLSSVLAIRQGYAAPDVGKALARAGALARQVGGSARLLGSLRNAFVYAVVGGDLDKADQVGRQTLELGRENGDPAFLAAGHRAVGTVAFSRGRLLEARQELEQAISLADTLDGSSPAEVLHDPAIGGRNKLAQTLWLLGDAQASDRVEQEALSLARRAGVVSLVDTLFMAGIRHALSGDDVAVRELSEEALALATQHGFPLYDGSTKVLRGWARVAQDGSPAGAEEMESALATVGSTGARMYSHLFFGLLADACLRIGRPDDALASIEKGLAEAWAGGERFWEAELMRLRGVLLAAGGGCHEDAEDSLLGAVEVARTQQAAGLESRATASLAELRNRRVDGDRP